MVDEERAEEIKEEIEELKERKDALDGYECYDEFDNFLNDVYGVVTVAGFEYDTARVLKEVDETAYRCGYNDWIDGELIEIEEKIKELEEELKGD